MEQLLNKGSSLSTLAFLRILQLVHVQVSTLVEDLKEYELTAATPRSPTESAELRRTVIGLTPSASVANLATVSLSSMLETAIGLKIDPFFFTLCWDSLSLEGLRLKSTLYSSVHLWLYSLTKL